MLDRAGIAEATAAASQAALEPFALQAASVSPLLGSMARTWHDALSEGERAALLWPMLPKLAGTCGSPAVEERRAVMHADWLVRCYAPNWLHGAGLKAHADRLARAPEFSSLPALLLLRPALEPIVRDANAAWAAARAAARAEIQDDAWRLFLNEFRVAVQPALPCAEASVRVPLEGLAWSKIEGLIWAAVEASIWAVAWTGLRTIRADSPWARVSAALTPLRTGLAGTAMQLLDRMASVVDPVPAASSGSRIVGDVLFGHDAEISAWVQQRIPEMIGREFGPCTTLGILRDGHLVGGVIYNHLRPHPDGGDVTVSAAFEPSCRISPATLKQMFSHPFHQLGCRRLTDFVIRSNKPARRFAERTGFRLEGVRRRGFGREDIFMFGMLREECRYLKRA